MINSRYSVSEFRELPEDLRIGIIISDGMWYSLTKWKKLARVTEPTITAWIEENLKTGRLLQSASGARSYRFPIESIREWYRENNYRLGEQIIDFLFPARIWSGMTETEGFLAAPLREMGMVSFNCSNEVAQIISDELRGIAKVREVEPGNYKAYCLDVTTVKPVVEKIFSEHEEFNTGRVYSRGVAKRRELVDFSPDFSHGLVMFYKNFGRTLVKGSMETIKIFLPDPEEQETQIIMWIIAAIEKFDESTSVPFSGYLDSVLRRWPYDLPYMHLGKELSNFQRQRSKVVNLLKAENPDRTDFHAKEIADRMGLDTHEFNSLEEKHRMWLGNKSSTSLTWAENGEEKSTTPNVRDRISAPTDVVLANRVSFALINAALESECYDDAFVIISQVDASNINIAKIREVSPTFISALGAELGIAGV
jgi:hypothetical protein